MLYMNMQFLYILHHSVKLWCGLCKGRKAPQRGVYTWVVHKNEKVKSLNLIKGNRVKSWDTSDNNEANDIYGCVNEHYC